MRYLSIYLPIHARPLIVIDTKLVNRELVREALYLADSYGGTGYLSNYKRLDAASFDRRLDTGEIKLTDVPERLNGDTLISFLEKLSHRGKDRAKRQMNPRSLANLRTGAAWNSTTRPVKPKTVSPEQIEHAQRLRNQGCSWRSVGDHIGVDHETLRSSIRRQSSNNIQ